VAEITEVEVYIATRESRQNGEAGRLRIFGSL